MNSSNWEDSDNWNTQEPSTKEKPNHSFLNKKRSDEQFSKVFIHFIIRKNIRKNT